MQKEIARWKEKYKLMSQYKREEDQNFKEQFDRLNSVEIERARYKFSINEMRASSGSHVPSSRFTGSMLRVSSQPSMQTKKKSMGSAQMAATTKLQRMIEQKEKRFREKKRQLLKTEEGLLDEIQGLIDGIKRSEEEQKKVDQQI